jgi:hypothetical protein
MCGSKLRRAPLTVARSVIGATENWAQSAAYWNLALDDKGGPLLPGTGSCKGGCRGMVTVKGNGDFDFNQECAWYMAPPVVSPLMAVQSWRLRRARRPSRRRTRADQWASASVSASRATRRGASVSLRRSQDASRTPTGPGA